MKQVIVMRADLNMSRGKIAAQACHGCLGAYKKADNRVLKKWESEGEKKVVLKVDDLAELFTIYELVKATNIPIYLVHDAGHTAIGRTARGGRHPCGDR